VKQFLDRLGEPRFNSLRQEIQHLRIGPRRKTDSRQLHHGPSLEEQIRLSLPDRIICDALIDQYFIIFGNIHAIFDEDEIRGQINTFWQNESPSSSSTDTFLPQFLGIISLGYFTQGISNNPSALSLDAIASHVILLDSWISSMRGRKRLRLGVVRTGILLSLIKTATMTRADEIWQENGSLLQLAMTLGLHRDPSEFNQFTPFEASQRRKVWFAVAEICLQNAMTCSMPLILSKSYYSCQPPEDGTILSNTFSPRCELWNLLVEMHTTIDRDEILAQLRALEALISDVTPYIDRSGLSPSATFVYCVQKSLVRDPPNL
jgi:hypothetical protein